MSAVGCAGSFWVDTHCHLDAAEFGAEASAQRLRAAQHAVAHCVIPAVEVANFNAVRTLAHAGRDSYCLGIHPLYVQRAALHDVEVLDAALHAHLQDPRLVGVGEIGLDFFSSECKQGPQRERQEFFYRAQLQLARKYALPVVLHARRSADALLKVLRELRGSGVSSAPWSGIVHAFNGSAVQAQAFIALGFKLGFGGALTFERAVHLRRLVQTLPLDALVLETDAPDMAPQWLYVPAQERLSGKAQARNTPAELPRIADVVAQLRGISLQTLAQATTHNSCQALPRLAALLV